MSLTEILAGSRRLDAIVIVVYLGASFLLGLVATRFFAKSDAEDHSEEDYYLAGRRVPGWLNGISTAVTAMNADVAPFYCGLAVAIGLPMAWFYLSRFAFAWLLLATVFAVRWRQSKVRTAPEFYAIRFGVDRARIVRIYMSLFGVSVNMIPWIGAGLLGVHKIMGPVFGIESKVTTLSIIIPLLLTYVWVSGFAGVIITDVLQSIVILVASCILLVFVMIDFQGPAGLAEAIRIAHPVNHVEILGLWPAPGHEVMGPLVVFAWFVASSIGQGGSLDLMGQRIFSCKNPREAAKMPVWALWTLFIMLLLLTLPVLGALARHPQLYTASSGERETVYGLLLDEYLPPGLLGVALAALLASVMSTVDSHLNYGAQTLVNDVLRQAFPHVRWLAKESALSLWVGRLIMIVMLAGAITVMFHAESLIGIASTLIGIFGATASFYWGQWWWWRVNFYSWLAAMVGGPCVYFALGWFLPQFPWWQELASRSPAMQDTMAMLQAVLGVAITTVSWVAVTLITSPLEMPILTHFYRTAKPMGFWRPVRAAIAAQGDEPLPPPEILWHGIIAAAFGTVWIASGILLLSQLIVANWTACLILAGVLAVTSVIFGVLFDRQMRRMI